MIWHCSSDNIGAELSAGVIASVQEGILVLVVLLAIRLNPMPFPRNKHYSNYTNGNSMI